MPTKRAVAYSWLHASPAAESAALATRRCNVQKIHLDYMYYTNELLRCRANNSHERMISVNFSFFKKIDKLLEFLFYKLALD